MFGSARAIGAKDLLQLLRLPADDRRFFARRWARSLGSHFQRKVGTDEVDPRPLGDLRQLSFRMGARVTVADDYTEVEGTGQLHGIDVDMADISDTAQTLAVVATFASGPTRVRGVGFIQHKETDRVGAVVTELQRLGIGARRLDDGFVVEPGVPRPGTVATYDDHRMAMSFALLGLVHPGITVENPGCVAKTFPRFFTVLDRLR